MFTRPAPLEGARTRDAFVVNDAVDSDSFTEDRVADDSMWLAIARDAYTSGREWFDTSVRRQVERALAHYRNQHAPGSKYHSELYSKRSRTFRPKPRSMVRRTEAAVAIAFFSTQDLVHVGAVNEGVPEQREAAEVHHHLLNYRLENTLPWYQTLIGGAQDAAVTGVVISKQYWHFETQDEDVINVYEDEETGEQSFEYGVAQKITKDEPRVDLIPIENLILDPGADWRDPVNSSPYCIELCPMYVWEIREKAKKINPRTGRPWYRSVAKEFLAAAIANDWDSIRKMREGGERVDKYAKISHINQYTIVWVRKVIARMEGRDWCFDCLGSEILLSDPEPIEDVFPHLEGRERPYKMGTMTIEAHKMYPNSTINIVEGMTEEINDLANLRMDNVKMALNKRTYIKRGAGVDIVTLLRNIPGSAVMMNNPATDVKESQPMDVTGSSYQEQDRLNLEFDEVAGHFSGSSISSNRKLSETVGGMSMLSADANQVKEYEVRTLSETWVEGVMRQLVKMEAYYESDETILEVVAAKTNMDLDRVMEVIKMPVSTRVEVGFSATNPQNRVSRMMYALDVIGKYRQDMLQQLDINEVWKEVFGALGYRDGARFLPSITGKEDPRVQQLMEQVQQLTQMLESRQAEKQMEIEGRIQVAEIGAMSRLQGTQLQLGVAAELGRMKMEIEAAKVELSKIDRQLAMEQTDVKRRELHMAREALSHEIQNQDREFLLKIQQAAQAAQQPQQPGGRSSAPKRRSTGGGTAGVIQRDNYGMIPGKADGVNPP